MLILMRADMRVKWKSGGSSYFKGLRFVCDSARRLLEEAPGLIKTQYGDDEVEKVEISSVQDEGPYPVKQVELVLASPRDRVYVK